MRPLIIDDNSRAIAAKIVAYAEAHPYRPPLGSSPGDDPGHVGEFCTYRTVFSFTHTEGLVLRHLSVSVPGGLYPNPIAVWMLADMFGFSGWTGGNEPGPTWTAMGYEEPISYVAIIEPMKMDVPQKERN